jgi:hypothetical protein
MADWCEEDSESQSKATSETTDDEKKEPTRLDDTDSITKTKTIGEKPEAEAEATASDSKGTKEEKSSVESKGNDDKTECSDSRILTMTES